MNLELNDHNNTILYLNINVIVYNYKAFNIFNAIEILSVCWTISIGLW